MKKIVKASLLVMMFFNLVAVIPTHTPVVFAEETSENVDTEKDNKTEETDNKNLKETKTSVKKEKRSSRRKRKQEKRHKFGMLFVSVGISLVIIATIILFFTLKTAKVRYSVTGILALLILAIILFFAGIIKVPGIPSKQFFLTTNEITKEKEAPEEADSTEEAKAEEEARLAEEARIAALPLGSVGNKNYMIGTIKVFTFSEYMDYLRNTNRAEEAENCEELCSDSDKNQIYQFIIFEEGVSMKGNDQGTIRMIDNITEIAIPKELKQYKNKKVYLEVEQEKMGICGGIYSRAMMEAKVIEVLD